MRCPPQGQAVVQCYRLQPAFGKNSDIWAPADGAIDAVRPVVVVIARRDENTQRVCLVETRAQEGGRVGSVALVLVQVACAKEGVGSFSPRQVEDSAQSRAQRFSAGAGRLATSSRPGESRIKIKI